MSRQLMEMANVRGNYVKTDNINFSFYFSDKTECNHAIRAKIKWNPAKVSGTLDGYVELHGNYNYVQSSSSDAHPSSKDIIVMQQFFRKYKVLFAAVWEMKLEADDVSDYFLGRIDLINLIDKFDNLDASSYMRLLQVSNITQLENVVREYQIFNMND